MTERECTGCRGRERIRGDELVLRSATADDVDLLFKWANDPDTRRHSFTSGPIPYEEHVRWFSAVLVSSDHLVRIGMRGSEPLGVVRLARQGSEAVVSITVAPEHRGRGVGTALTAALTRDPAVHEFCERVAAYVKPQNVASRRLFAACGFSEAIITEADPHPQSLKMVWCPPRIRRQ